MFLRLNVTLIDSGV